MIGNLSNKLLSICYAGSPQEIAPFAVCDMAPLVASFCGVIDCKLLECVLIDYQADSNFQHLQVKVGMLVTKYGNGGVRQEKINLALTLVKSIRALTQSINDVNVYRCDSCGASLSLLNGGKCEYCGHGLDLKEYDWVIKGYLKLQAAFHSNPTPVFCLFDLDLLRDILHKLLPMADDSHQLVASGQVN